MVRRVVAVAGCWRKSGTLLLLAVVATGLSTVGTASAASAVQPAPPGTVEPTGPVVTLASGVTEQSQDFVTTSGKQHTHVLDVDLTDPKVRLGVVQAGNHVTDPADETVSSMADRTGALAGVNGDYFEIGTTGRPLGGVVSGGTILKSPRPGFDAQLTVRSDGSASIGPQTFAGQITDDEQSTPLASVNVVDDAAAGRITEITSTMGATGTLATAATLVTGHLSGPDDPDDFVVDSVTPSAKSVPALPATKTALLGGGAGGTWLTGTVHPGDTVAVTGQISPDASPQALISGATMLVKGGAVYRDPTGTPPGGVNPETAVGVSADGHHVTMVTFDGRLDKAVAVGVTPTEVATYLLQRKVYSGMLLDGGGSTEMVARLSGKSTVTVLNVPSDQRERHVANGLFVYTRP
jgi:exopolysaccharide biosynthesis protein